MTKPKPEALTDYFRRYIDHVKEENLMDALLNQLPHFTTFLRLIPAAKEDFAYGPGKWTVKEVIQHITDTERVFAYRALCFSRQDNTPLPGFDQDEYVTHSNARHRSMADLIEEFDLVRRSTISLYKSFTEAQLYQNGTASERQSNPLLLGFALAGHCSYHEAILKEKYL
jgi:hypothetical protein